MNKRDQIADILGDHFPDVQSYYLKKAADEIMALDDWTPVSERLPEDGVDVLIWVKSIDKPRVAMMDDEEDGEPNFYTTDSYIHPLSDITHWEPIEGPKDEQA